LLLSGFLRTMPANRRVALVVSVAVHLVVIALLFLSHVDRPALRPERGMSLIDTLSDRDTEAQPQQEAEKPDVDVTPQPGETLFPVELPMVAQVAASSGPQGETCQIAAAIQADLLVDEPARAEIAAIPFDARSVANAIVLWTGAPENIRPVLPATDMLVLKRLETIPQQCLDVDQAGPDFIYATVDNRTVSIAIGSGQWRWRSFFDLLSTTNASETGARAYLPRAGMSVFRVSQGE
jgi:hypothetical protein